jgi:hypothetical protein
MHLLFPPVVDVRILFPLSLLVTIFHPFLIMCQLFIPKDFETSLLTLLGVSLVYGGERADNEHSNPLFYCPSPLNSQHLHFQFTVASLLNIFVRSRCDWEKKCWEGSRQDLLRLTLLNATEFNSSFTRVNLKFYSSRVQITRRICKL